MLPPVSRKTFCRESAASASVNRRLSFRAWGSVRQIRARLCPHPASDDGQRFSRVRDLVDHRYSLAADLWGNVHFPYRLFIRHLVVYPARDAHRVELAAQTTGDKCGWEQACSGNADDDLYLFCGEPFYQLGREFCESLPRDLYDPLPVSIVIALHVGPFSHLSVRASAIV